METKRSHILALRVLKPESSSTPTPLWLWVGKGHNRYSESFTRNVWEAVDLTDLSVSELIIKYQDCARKYGIQNVQVQQIRFTVEAEDVDLDSDTYLEERRRVALAKLSDDDIRALGVQKLATYNKLKYHNADDDVMLDCSIIVGGYK